MAVPSVDKLTYAQLLDLQVNISNAIEFRKQEEKAGLKKKMAALAASSGFDLDDLVGNKRGARKGGKVAPKYKHPKDPILTWTGPGRQPLWLAGELKKGKKLHSFAI